MPTLGSQAPSAYDPWTLQKSIGLADARFALDSMLMPVPNLSYLDYRSGVMASGDSELVNDESTHMAMRVQATDTFAVTVEMGNCVINTQGLGAYMCALDSRKTLAINPASSTQNRKDLIVARVYDDMSAAIGSPPGQRKFQVEVWTGDPSTGDALEPEPTVSAGWIPLALIDVPASATGLTGAITDRRGPGLVARGGMRALYGDDADHHSEAFNEPGAYPGDQRWVHNHVFQHQVYFGGGENPDLTGWRGVHNFAHYTAIPPGTGVRWARGRGTVREICRVTVPYRGVPYALYPTARIAANISAGTQIEFRITVDGPNGEGGWINWMREENGWTQTSRQAVANIAPMRFGPLYRDADVVLSGRVIDAADNSSGFSHSGGDRDTRVQAGVFPSIVQPAGAPW